MLLVILDGDCDYFPFPQILIIIIFLFRCCLPDFATLPFPFLHGKHSHPLQQRIQNNIGECYYFLVGGIVIFLSCPKLIIPIFLFCCSLHDMATLPCPFAHGKHSHLLQQRIPHSTGECYYFFGWGDFDFSPFPQIIELSWLHKMGSSSLREFDKAINVFKSGRHDQNPSKYCKLQSNQLHNERL